MDGVSYEVRVGNADPIALADGSSREEAEAEADHYRRNLYPGERVRLYAVTRVLIDDGSQVTR